MSTIITFIIGTRKGRYPYHKSDIYFFIFLAILIVSGHPANYSVQALNHDGHYLCDLPDIPSPYGRFGATMDGHILCGGIENSNLTNNCICYDMGSWINPQDRIATKNLRRFEGRATDTGSMIL